MVEMICQSRRGFVRLAVLCAFFFCTAAAGASSLTPSPSEEAQATLDADAIRYDETTSIAVAEGNVVLHYQDLTVHAGRMVMYADTGLVQAFAEDKGKVVLERAKGETLAGSFVEYHLQSSSGFMEGARASVPVGKGLLYISGTKTEVKSADEAQRAKWVNGKYLRRVSPDALVNRWIDASYTTCRLESDPHYKMMSKRLVVVPGKYVVLQRPRFYAGKSYLFASPFNVALRQDGRRNGQITIRPDYKDKKYGGIVASTQYSWKTGGIKASVGYWHGANLEYSLEINQKITDWMWVYAGDGYLYDPDMDRVESRPYWGARFAHGGWSAELAWAQREKQSIVKRPGEKAYETTLWRDPEFAIKSPWVGLHLGDFSQYARLKGNWGRFQETGSMTRHQNGFIERYGWGVDYYTEYPFRVGGWTFSPFFKGDYWNYGYKNDGSDRQIISIGTLGLRMSRGIFEFGTAYEQTRVSGRTGLRGGWDRESDEETLYNRIGVKIGPSLKFEVQGIIDMDGRSRDLTSMGYILTYDNSCCTRWRLTVNDDLTDANDNDWVSLSFEITALPESRFILNEEYLDNPFGRPGGLQMKRRSQSVPVTHMEKTGTEDAEKDEIRLPVLDGEEPAEQREHNHHREERGQN